MVLVLGKIKMISETATELVNEGDPTMFWIAVAVLVILFIAATFEKSVYI
jgi:hypothetical protein